MITSAYFNGTVNVSDSFIYDYGGLTHFKCLENFLFLQSFVINHRARGIRLDELCINLSTFDKGQTIYHTFFFTSKIKSKKYVCEKTTLCIVRDFLPCMYLSKYPMSPAHSSRLFHARRRMLARLPLASPTSALASVHIPAAARPPHFKSDE